MSYDYIIAGSGCAGLMLAYKLALDPYFDNHQILLIDKDTKTSNDRTWCYWEKGEGTWDCILTKEWNRVYFGSETYKKSIPLDEYKYKMVRGADFYNFVKKVLKEKANIHFLHQEIVDINDNGPSVQVTTSTSVFETKKVFSSLFDPKVINRTDKYPYLKQHFVGWFVDTEKDVFNENEATFMDFDIPQQGNTRFMYILPLSPNKALVEYTLFSEDLLLYEDYEKSIETYMVEKYGFLSFKITEKESGNIPMTSFPFENNNTANVLHIGSAGGWSKPSTGYTFAMSDRNTSALVAFLKKEKDLSKFSTNNIFKFLDNAMLRVLKKRNDLGSDIFTGMFKNNPVQRIFKFLDEKTNVLETLLVMHSVKHLKLFTKAVMGRLK